MMNAVMGRLGKKGTELAVAGAIGLFAAIGIFLVPIDILEQLVLESGLPGVFPPADPPLGMKAQIGFALAAALLCFAITYAMMLVIDGASKLFEDSEDDTETAPAAAPAPRLRKRDRHPDGPVCAPLSALRDLGEPGRSPATPMREESEPESAPAANRELPWRRKKKPTEEEPAAEVASRRAPWRRAEPEEGASEDRLRRIRGMREPETSFDSEPAPEPVEPAAGPKPVALPPIETASEPVDELTPWSQRKQPVQLDPIPAPEPLVAFEPEPVAAAEPEEDELELHEAAALRPDEAERAPAPAAPMPQENVEPHSARPAWLAEQPEADQLEDRAPTPRFTGQESIAELMERLERAMASRAVGTQIGEERPVPAPPMAQAPETDLNPAAPEPMDTRLRSALENLKKFAPRQA